MTNRREFIRSIGISAAGCAISGCRTRRCPSAVSSWAYDGVHRLDIQSPCVQKPVRLRFLADTHLALADERDSEHADFYRRLAQWPTDKKTLAATLPKPGDCDLLVLGGDNMSFPTLANVEYLYGALQSCGVPFAYVAGNHDWHFEGDAGSDMDQRDRWISRRLKPLYRGRNPLMSAIRVNGLKVILIDNSVYHVIPEQVEFLRQEVSDGMPAVVFMHIPFWQNGWSVTTCACPHWGAANDPYWQIERRERWAERLMPSTFAFRETVMSASSIVGVFAGHEHRFMSAGENGKPSFVVPGNAKGGYFDITIG